MPVFQLHCLGSTYYQTLKIFTEITKIQIMSFMCGVVIITICNCIVTNQN